MAGGEEIVIHSYRSVFDLERRIYRIDTLRLNPGGVPLRGILYAATLAVAALVMTRISPLGWPLQLLPWYLRLLLAPALGGALLCVIRLEGRTFHLAALALVRHVVSPRLLCGLARPSAPAPGRRWSPGELVAICDGSEPRLRRLRYRGPGRALVRQAHHYARPTVGARLHTRGGDRRLLLLPATRGQWGRAQRPAALHGGGERLTPEVIEVGEGAQLVVAEPGGR
ncbi:MAG TPA: hypothetical protein VKU89_09760 [Solirubrobacteraceae bacterium]|nr:hypothetical protein [Solirubrobacteraceae bacterium]